MFVSDSYSPPTAKQLDYALDLQARRGSWTRHMHQQFSEEITAAAAAALHGRAPSSSLPKELHARDAPVQRSKTANPALRGRECHAALPGIT